MYQTESIKQIFKLVIYTLSSFVIFLFLLSGGIVVNEQMETNVGGIYAAGDVCHAGWVDNRVDQVDSTPSSKHWFQMRLWTQARQMGLHAGQCMQVYNSITHSAINEFSQTGPIPPMNF